MLNVESEEIHHNLKIKNFSEAGCVNCIYSTKEAYESEIVLKVDPPTLKEIEYLKPEKKTLYQLFSQEASRKLYQPLIKKRVTGIAFEFLKDQAGAIPVIRAMSEIAGSTVLLIAAEYLSSVNNGKGIILGGITGVPPHALLY